MANKNEFRIEKKLDSPFIDFAEDLDSGKGSKLAKKNAKNYDTAAAVKRTNLKDRVSRMESHYDVDNDIPKEGKKNGIDYGNYPDFEKSYSSYSGSDCTVVVQLNGKLIIIGNLETISHSIHREKSPVRVLGRSHPKGYTAGPRTIAGSMVFVVFDRAPLYDIIRELNYVRNPSDRFTSPLPDQLPPLDLILLFNNEYGHQSITKLFGVEFLDEGQVHSINDIYSECTMQYVAKDMDQMISYGQIADFKKMMFDRQSKGYFVDNRLNTLLAYESNLRQKITSCDNEVAYLTNRYPIDPPLTDVNGNEISNNAANRTEQINKQVALRARFLDELNTVLQQITKIQTSVEGWNAVHGDSGVSTSNYDYVGHAMSTARE